jgi:hypothetical protein
MTEGWYENDYWSMCDDQKEGEELTTAYGLADYLPGYFIVGLKGWDDFILCDLDGQYFLVPTVPLERSNLESFHFPALPLRLESDDRFTGKIKWYKLPIKFGGNPSAEENMAWLSQTQHVEAVKWWNKLYQEEVTKQRKPEP